MVTLTQFASVVFAGLAAGAVGDLIAESTLLDKWREKLDEDSPFACRFCVSAWACAITVPLSLYFPETVYFLAFPVAWKVSTALRGWYG